jgi:hypothetical protein
MAEVVRSVLGSLAPMDTLDLGCGTGYVSGRRPDPAHGFDVVARGDRLQDHVKL